MVFNTDPLDRGFICTVDSRADESVEGKGPCLAPTTELSKAAKDGFDEAGVHFDVVIGLEISEDLPSELNGLGRG